ncbi:hypothetical protein K440DRAFT_629768 [Wilcoxina mikolae CBS 423.85]|nr:hypothetical protein K440DRAFT_629768 [Wilcoxina mikolae CBS 423.85]
MLSTSSSTPLPSSTSPPSFPRVSYAPSSIRLPVYSVSLSTARRRLCPPPTLSTPPASSTPPLATTSLPLSFLSS